MTVTLALVVQTWPLVVRVVVQVSVVVDVELHRLHPERNKVATVVATTVVAVVVE